LASFTPAPFSGRGQLSFANTKRIAKILFFGKILIAKIYRRLCRRAADANADRATSGAAAS
jgi:hypothetical protein